MMINDNLHVTNWLKKGASFLLFFILETMVFAIITFSPKLSGDILLNFHILLTTTLLVMALESILFILIGLYPFGREKF